MPPSQMTAQSFTNERVHILTFLVVRPSPCDRLIENTISSGEHVVESFAD